MKTVANLFATTHAVLGADQQKDRHFITIERYPPEDDGFCSFVKSVEGLAQNEYWIAREKNILMLLKKTPYVVRIRKEEEEKTNSSYQTVKTKDAGITLAHWLRTKPTVEAYHQPLKHPFENVGAFLNLTKSCLLALKHIHQAGVVHANLRPDNICLPYAPCPYEFNTELKIDYENIALIDFMFAISSTLKLSRPLPILSTQQPSTQSALLISALDDDRKNRNAERSQRLDYSVDLYALGFILDQIFQQNLIYPEHLHAELSMEIHNFIAELKSYSNGVPDQVKMEFLHLQPHDGYLKHIDYLLSFDSKAINADAQLLTFDPAQFLEDDLLFPSETGLLEAETVTMTVDNNSNAGTTSNTLSEPYVEDSMEINKGIVITLIITFQAMYFIYTAGDELSLDILPSLLLIFAVGLAITAGIFVLTPKAPVKSRPTLLELDIPTLAANPATAKAAPVLVANNAALYMNSDDHSADVVVPMPVTEAQVQPAHTQIEEVEDPASYVELDKNIVITVLITGQVMYFVYTEGDNLNLDILSTMSLLLVIGALIACATKLFSPKNAPKLRPTIIEPLAFSTAAAATATPVTPFEAPDVPFETSEIPLASPVITQTEAPIVVAPEIIVPAVSPAAVTIASLEVVTPQLDKELDALLASAPVVAEPIIDQDVANAALPTLSTPVVTPTPVQASAAPAKATPADDDKDSMTLNKWGVIAAILVFQIGYFLMTTDFSKGDSDAPKAAAPEATDAAVSPSSEAAPEALATETAPTEVAPTAETPAAEAVAIEPAPMAAAPTVAAPAKTAPTKVAATKTVPVPHTEAAAANIALLNEVTSVKTPEVAPVKSKKDRADESVLLSGAGESSVSRVSKDKAAKKALAKKAVAPVGNDSPGITAPPDNDANANTTAKTDGKDKANATVAPVAAIAANTPADADNTKADAKATPKSITRGLAEAQNVMGWHYYHGDGVARDYEESFKWFQKAANLGEPSAQFNVGMMYAAGTGTKQDFNEAAKWYKKAAEQGKTSAQLNLGMMYISGRGIRQNLPEGVKWLTKAADQGDATAKANLAWLSQQGYVQTGAAAPTSAANGASATVPDDNK